MRTNAMPKADQWPGSNRNSSFPGDSNFSGDSSFPGGSSFRKASRGMKRLSRVDRLLPLAALLAICAVWCVQQVNLAVAVDAIADESASAPARNIADETGQSTLSAEQSLALLETDPELQLRVDLVAREPQVVDPVAIAFDEFGRLFVAEMRDYPTGPAEGQAPLSRIRLLEDTDRDGRFETAHSFAESISFVTGLLPWRGGLIVTVAGEVRYLKDTSGDFEADLNELWFRGFAEENSQLRANHPCLGPDGKVYIANGLRGGTIVAQKPGWPQEPVVLRDGDFCFDPLTGKAEAVAGGSQFGLAFDAFGHRFLCSNRNPCDQVVLELADLARSPPAGHWQAGSHRRGGR